MKLMKTIFLVKYCLWYTLQILLFAFCLFCLGLPTRSIMGISFNKLLLVLPLLLLLLVAVPSLFRFVVIIELTIDWLELVGLP